jgi:hypothetical protein
MMQTTLASLTPEKAIRSIWKLCDKPERIRSLDSVDRIHHLDERLFWETFWHMWESHESIFLDHPVIEDMISRHDEGLSTSVLDADEIETLTNLPECIDIYRGCRSHNVKGWSWTLDRSRAEFFAKRSAGKGRPMVLHGIAPRDRVLAYLNGRDEQEIVIKPDFVLIHYREPVANLTGKANRMNALMQAIHASTDLFPVKDSAMMAVVHSIRSGSDLAKVRSSLVDDAMIASEFNGSKGIYLNEVIRVIDGYLTGDEDIRRAVDAFGQFGVEN